MVLRLLELIRIFTAIFFLDFTAVCGIKVIKLIPIRLIIVNSIIEFIPFL